MRIKWLGHASFLITSNKGIKILTDPYTTGGELSYSEIRENADIVTISHEHFDHANTATIGGNPQIVTQATYLKGISFHVVFTFHDKTGGKNRGNNNVFCFEVDRIKICHLGDLGHELNSTQASEIGQVDVLLIPVGGYYTIDAEEATKVCNLIKPNVIIPMHFKNERCAFPIAKVDEFLKGKKNIRKLDNSEVEFIQGKLPESTQVIVLQPAL